MKYYGIKTPEDQIHWVSKDERTSWGLFFQYPNEKQGIANFYRLSMAEAQEAYQAIGYRCVELDVTEIQ